LDEINEKNRGEEKLGTTKKGIGPAYEDKIGRRAIRLCDLSDEKLLRKKITNLISFHSVRLIHFDKKINEADLINKLLKVFNKISQYLAPTWKILNDYGKNEKIILFEGAQGALLDIDFGTYPFVTSSNTSSGQIFAGTGFGIKDNHQVFGITKAYTTRVGSGPFPSELFDEIGNYLVVKGKEFGTVTKRKRRCGWFDTILVKQTVQINGVSNIILTKLDVLDELNEIKICVGYKIDNYNYDYLPFNENLQQKISPIYKIIPGWKSSTFGITEWSDLPKNAQNYINYIEEVIKIKISIISTGPERSQTIDRNNILSNI
ncbi:MAG: Adenylosuccinate synthetase, partial [Alphaproteobacteria bacterium MarineAlpha5_Bin1]